MGLVTWIEDLIDRHFASVPRDEREPAYCWAGGTGQAPSSLPERKTNDKAEVISGPQGCLGE